MAGREPFPDSGAPSVAPSSQQGIPRAWLPSPSLLPFSYHPLKTSFLGLKRRLSSNTVAVETQMHDFFVTSSCSERATAVGCVRLAPFPFFPDGRRPQQVRLICGLPPAS